MRLSQIIVFFLLLAIMLGGLSVPLWWDRAQPIIFGIPGYVAGVISDLTEALDYILKSI